MKVYTRKGDDGSTSLADGTRVAKSAARVAAYGDVDELNAIVGLLRAELGGGPEDGRLSRVQSVLFEVGAFLANPTGAFALPDEARDASWLEAWIDAMEEDLPPLRQFVLPAGTRAAAASHAARTVCRRAERQVVAAGGEDPRVRDAVPLLNRLSDTFFVLARWLNHSAGVGDTPWRAGS